jgi:REP element-mobilizing transposase RayT
MQLFPHVLHHGGELSIGRRKALRPLARKRPLHLVLKSRRSLRRHGPLISKEAHRLAEKFSCRLYDIAVAEDHIHLVLLIAGRKEYKAFIRSLTGLLARKIQKGLFMLLAFTRVANWGKDFQRLKSYLKKNREEASGERSYEPREDWYRRYRRKPRERAPAFV